MLTTYVNIYGQLIFMQIMGSLVSLSVEFH